MPMLDKFVHGLIHPKTFNEIVVYIVELEDYKDETVDLSDI
jgi:hypothetical protein